MLGDRGVDQSSFDDFEQSNLAANLTIGAVLTPAEEEMANMMRREMQEENMGEIGAEAGDGGEAEGEREHVAQCQPRHER